MKRNTKSGAAKIAALAAELSADAQEQLGAFLELVVSGQNADALDDLADDIKPRRRGSTAKPAASRRAKKGDDDEDDLADLDEDEAEDEDEDEKPARAKRGSKTSAKPAPKRGARKAAEPDEDEDEEDEDEEEAVDLTEATLENIEEFLTTNSFEPVTGGVRALKPVVESWGADYEEVTADGDDRREKAELAGVFIASMTAAFAKLKKCDEDDLATLAEELGIEPGRNASATAKAILIAINENEDAGDEDEDEEDED